MVENTFKNIDDLVEFVNNEFSHLHEEKTFFGNERKEFQQNLLIKAGETAFLTLVLFFLFDSAVPAKDLVSDFRPARGASNDLPRDARVGQLGPWNTRILEAISQDGLRWRRTGHIVADQVDVPCAVVDDKGQVWLYSVTWAKAVRNRIVVAIGSGNDWVYKRVNVERLERGWAVPVDPTVVRMKDGRVRLYFTSNGGPRGRPRTFSAVSDDWLRFKIEKGVRFESGRRVLDPSVLAISSGYVLFAGGGPDGNHMAVSADGLDFERVKAPRLDGLILSNGLAVQGGFRYYAFTQTGRPGTPRKIRSVFSPDGRRWKVESGVRLAPDRSNELETGEVKDPTVVRMPDGSYRMYYVTGIPGSSAETKDGAGHRRRR